MSQIRLPVNPKATDLQVQDRALGLALKDTWLVQGLGLAGLVDEEEAVNKRLRVMPASFQQFKCSGGSVPGRMSGGRMSAGSGLPSGAQQRP